MISKPFEKLLVGEEVYTLKPLSLEILTTTVLKSQVHPKSNNQFVWVLEFYKPTSLPLKDLHEQMKIAKDNFGADTTLTVFLPKNESIAMIMIRPFPTMIATERKILETWINQVDKETLQLLGQLRDNQKL